MSKIGRNEPCPCGSGKKFKKCCMRGDSEHRQQLETFDEVVDEAITWLQDRFAEDLSEAVEEQFLSYMPEEGWESFVELPDDIRKLVSINAYEWALVEGHTRENLDAIPLLDLVLGHGGPIMEADQRQFLESLRHAHLNLYEVVGSKAGHSLKVRELLGDDPQTRWVFSPSFSKGEMSRPGTVVGLRLIPGTPWRHTMAAYYFPGSWTAGVLKHLRKNLEDTPHPEDHQFAYSAPIVHDWLSLLTAKPPSLLDRSSGDAILLVTDHYRIEDLDLLTQRLEQQSDVEPTDEGWVRLRDRSDGTQTSLVSLSLGAEKETLEVFGRTRNYADDGKVWLEELAGDAITYVTRDISDPLSMGGPMAFASPESGARSGPPIDPEELSKAMEGFYRKIYANWADEPIPALDGRTPRQAVQDPEGRRQVTDLLESYERSESLMAEDQGREPLKLDFLREEVGLSD